MVDELFAGWDLSSRQQLIYASNSVFIRQVGERAERNTIINGITLSRIKKRYQPQIDLIKSRVESRQKQIENDKTPEEQKRKLLIDQKNDKKILLKQETSLQKRLRPYQVDNQLQNSIINQAAENLNLTSQGNGFRDWAVMSDKWVNVIEGSDTDNTASTPFAPTMGWMPGTTTNAQPPR